MIKYAEVIHKDLTSIHSRLLVFTLFFSMAALLQPQAINAHTGPIMDGGYTPEYEWLVSSFPGQPIEGPNLISFVIYDIDTYEPINGMRVEVLISHPSSEIPCCNAEDHIGPIELEADPENWPGDYSYELPLNGFGTFALKFIAYKGDSTEPAIEVISRILVLPDFSKITPEPNPNISPLDNPTVSESPVSDPNSPSDTMNNSTITATTTTATSSQRQASVFDKVRSQWMLWSTAGLIPLTLLAFLIFRPSMDELIAQKEAELTSELDADDSQ